MQVKTLSFVNYSVINVIVSEEHHFLTPVRNLHEHFGMAALRRPAETISKRLEASAFIWNVHFVKHNMGDVQAFKNLKPGSNLITRAGLMLLCNTISTPESELIKRWAYKHTYEVIANNGSSIINRLFRSVLMEVYKIPDDALRKSIVEKLKILEIRME